MGNKKIIGFVARFESRETGELQSESSAITVSVHKNDFGEKNYNLILHQGEDVVEAVTHIDVCGMTCDKITAPLNIIIYAICI